MTFSDIPLEIEEESPNTKENVNFPMTQSTPQTSTLIKQAELSRRVFLYLIEKYNLAPSVILYSLYIHSGNVAACESYLSNPNRTNNTASWSLKEDKLILTDSDCTEIIEKKRLEGLNERRTFLHQVCNEAIGSCSEITSKLK